MRKKIKKMELNTAFVCQFAMDDFKTKYSGSILGLIWAFIQPIITVVIYWFIFQVGFNNDAVSGYPFILWLVAGLAPWMFISDAIVNATNSLVEYSYLVKKVVFNITILPLAKVVSVFFIQVVLVVFTIILFLAYGYMPSIYWLQLIYYMIYMVVLCVGISYFTSALYVFLKDVAQVVAILIQVIFWVTPIVWQVDIMPENIQKIIQYNPIYYVVRGYRDSFLRQNSFCSYKIGTTIYFWTVALIILALGIYVFKKLKHHFADVL